MRVACVVLPSSTCEEHDVILTVDLYLQVHRLSLSCLRRFLQHAALLRIPRIRRSIHNSLNSVHERLNHLIRHLRRRRRAQRSIQRIRELKLNHQIHLRLLLPGQRTRLLMILMHTIRMRRTSRRRFVRIRLQRPPREQMANDRILPARIAIRRGSRAVMRNLLAVKGALRRAADGFHCSSRHAVDAARELLADGVVEADDELGFLRVGPAIARRGGVFGYEGVLAEGDELVVGGDVGDDVVDYAGGVAEGALGGEGLVWGEGA